MGLQEKIEEIRQKPEHIRRRYVWILTAVSMFFILIIWALSVSTQVKTPEDNTLSQEEKIIIEEFSSHKESLKDKMDGLKNAYDQSKINPQSVAGDETEATSEGFAR